MKKQSYFAYLVMNGICYGEGVQQRICSWNSVNNSGGGSALANAGSLSHVCISSADLTGGRSNTYLWCHRSQ